MSHEPPSYREATELKDPDCSIYINEELPIPSAPPLTTTTTTVNTNTNSNTRRSRDYRDGDAIIFIYIFLAILIVILFSIINKVIKTKN